MTYYIVVYDDENGVCCPMGWDADCEGALTGMGKAVALFASRQDARAAIRISTAWAKLCQAQGKPVNADFIDGLKYVKVVPCVARTGATP